MPHLMITRCNALIVFFLLFMAWAARAQDGFCMVSGATTGGAGGPTITVTNGTDFVTQVGMTGARTIQVSGVLAIGDITVRSDKTVVGLGTDAVSRIFSFLKADGSRSAASTPTSRAATPPAASSTHCSPAPVL